MYNRANLIYIMPFGLSVSNKKVNCKVMTKANTPLAKANTPFRIDVGV